VLWPDTIVEEVNSGDLLLSLAALSIPAIELAIEISCGACETIARTLSSACAIRPV